MITTFFHVSRTVIVVSAAVLLGSVLGVLLRTELPARAATTSNLGWLSIREDHFYNYDFNSQLPLSNNVDWPITMLFWNNANVNKVKSITGYLYDGGPQYLVVDDSGGTGAWDQDSGKKDILCPSINAGSRHMRVYADGDDRLYNVDWGYYVLGSTHRDWQECWFGSQFGWSETIEGQFASLYSSKGYSVLWSYGDFWNAEPNRWEGNHFWQSDGKATYVNIP